MQNPAEDLGPAHQERRRVLGSDEVVGAGGDGAHGAGLLHPLAQAVVGVGGGAGRAGHRDHAAAVVVDDRCQAAHARGVAGGVVQKTPQSRAAVVLGLPADRLSIPETTQECDRVV